MTSFKVGDRVRSKADGDLGVIQGFDDHRIWVNFELDGNSWDTAEQLELVEATSFEQSVHRVTGKIADLLIAKNKAYGDSALNPVRIFSKASRIEQLNVRIDDKISRIQRGTDFGDEDTVRDLIGYLVLRLIAEESE